MHRTKLVLRKETGQSSSTTERNGHVDLEMMSLKASKASTRGARATRNAYLEGCSVRRGSYEVEHTLLDKPGLGDARNDISDDQLEEDFP